MSESTENTKNSDLEQKEASPQESAEDIEKAYLDQLAQKEAELLQLQEENKGLSAYKQKAEDYESKLSDIRDYVRRMEREIELIRERSERDAELNLDQRVLEVLSQFLSVLDNLDRSLDSATESSSAFFKGIEMIRNQFMDVLQRTGLQRIHSQGERFDPKRHEALSVQNIEDASKDETVLQEVQAGYRYKELVIRPAHVIVGRYRAS